MGCRFRVSGWNKVCPRRLRQTRGTRPEPARQVRNAGVSLIMRKVSMATRAALLTKRAPEPCSDVEYICCAREYSSMQPISEIRKHSTDTIHVPIADFCELSRHTVLVCRVRPQPTKRKYIDRAELGCAMFFDIYIHVYMSVCMPRGFCGDNTGECLPVSNCECI